MVVQLGFKVVCKYQVPSILDTQQVLVLLYIYEISLNVLPNTYVI